MVESDNPYAPPRSQVAADAPQPTRTMPVLVGVMVGCGLVYVVLTICVWFFVWFLAAQGVASKDIYLRVYQSDAYLLFAHAGGFLCLMYGGSWTARLTQGGAAMNAAIAGILVVAFSFMQLFVPYDVPIPMWSSVMSVVAPIPAYLLGSRLWSRNV
jgi:hypothetical protein